MKKYTTAILLFVTGSFVLSFVANAKSRQREYYQITVYHFATAEQEKKLDAYLSAAYLPAIHKLSNRKVGVFKPFANDTAADKLIYIIVPFKKAEQLFSLTSMLLKDRDFVLASQYFDTSYKTPAFSRMENIVLQAFSLAPIMKLPNLKSNRQERIFELRSYESATEKLYRNKVEMFNEGGEIEIFSRLNFNPVFYAEVIAGSRMPNLMYMTSFENKADRDAHWKSFSADDKWKKLSAMSNYQHNVSKSEVKFLRATDYSDY